MEIWDSLMMELDMGLNVGLAIHGEELSILVSQRSQVVSIMEV